MEEQAPAVPPRSWFGRNWKWLLPFGCLLPFVVVGGCTALVVLVAFGALRQSTAYQMSLAVVQADEKVQAALGQPIESAMFVRGSVNIATGDRGDADINYDISGPKDKGTVHVIAVQRGGNWKLKKLTVDVESTGDQIDVLRHLHKESVSDETI